MTEPAPAPAPSAGAQLRAARERQGVHIAVLAANIKVAQRKLEALEADRYDELPDAAFTRALAQTVCRALKADPAPVLAQLPAAAGSDRLAQVGGGLNAPFREQRGRDDGGQWTFVNRPVFWAPAIVLLSAAVLYLLPIDWVGGPDGDADRQSVVTLPPAPATAASDAGGTATSTEPAPTVVETVHSAPPSEAASDVAAADADPSSGGAAPLLQIRASEDSWVEVRDAQGNLLLSRTLQPGESVGVEGSLPLRATIGNAASTSISLRGQPLDLGQHTRDNVARLEIR
jgi:cytoskeleton protein RodZ